MRHEFISLNIFEFSHNVTKDKFGKLEFQTVYIKIASKL